MPWATLAEVNDTPGGESSTQADLDLAQMMIEDLAGTTEAASDAGNISSRNLRHLHNAVLYQTIFVTAHPELLTTQDVISAAGDGLSAQYRTAEAQWYAPLASRAVRRLTWMTRPLRVRRIAEREEGEYGNRDSAAFDDSREWAPL